MSLRIIAIDPGYDRCGVAVLERTDQGDSLLFSDCITTNKDDAFETRLVFVVRAIRDCIETYKPSHCALEDLFFTTNRKTAMRVAEVRGALIALITEQELSLHEIGPGEIKVAITGDGRASKEQMMLMVPKLIPIKKNIRYDDEYDAIAIALAASALYRHTQ